LEEDESGEKELVSKSLSRARRERKIATHRARVIQTSNLRGLVQRHPIPAIQHLQRLAHARREAPADVTVMRTGGGICRCCLSKNAMSRCPTDPRMARDRCASAAQYDTWKRKLRTSRYDTIPGAGSDAL
jgi:hypothetical protein